MWRAAAVVLVPSLFWAYQLHRLSGQLSVAEHALATRSNAADVSSENELSPPMSLIDCYTANNAAIEALNDEIDALKRRCADTLAVDRERKLTEQRERMHVRSIAHVYSFCDLCSLTASFR